MCNSMIKYMKSRAIFFLALLSTSVCFSEDGGKAYELEYQSANIRYVIYGQEIDEPISPTVKDSKIAFVIEGKAAKNIFDSIPPDRGDEGCVSTGDRLRSRDNHKFSCVKYKDGTYTCTFGFDLKSGKSIGGSTC